MKILLRIIKLLLSPSKLARFTIVLYRYRESKKKINGSGVCMYKLSCSKYAYRVFKKHNFVHGLYLAWQRYYCCTPKRYNKKIDIEIKYVN